MKTRVAIEVRTTPSYTLLLVEQLLPKKTQNFCLFFFFFFSLVFVWKHWVSFADANPMSISSGRGRNALNSLRRIRG
jgi:hypothetical protein